MNVIFFLINLNYYLAVPTAFLLMGVALFLTHKLGLIQIRYWARFFKLLRHGIRHDGEESTLKTITPFQALFTAMSTSLGIGTIVGPSIAIIMGGPGALFWLVFYSLCASITKYAEVAFALYFRTQTASGQVLGGPMQYLMVVHRSVGLWYAYATIILFASWSGLQSNVLAETLAQEGIPEWWTGMCIAILTFIMLRGGARVIGEFNSKLVPFMSTLYITFSLYIIWLHRLQLIPMLKLIGDSVIAPSAAAGGLAGATLYAAMKSGIYKGAYITESGIGTAAIPHSFADVKRPTDQATLAMISVYADTFLCFLSGLVVLITDVWRISYVSNTLMYRVFSNTLPVLGKPVLIITISLFAFGTIVGNSFNGRQSYAAVTHYRYMTVYYLFVCAVIFVGAVSTVPLVWEAVEILMPLVVIPNGISIVYLTLQYPKVLTD